jgi:hypothetical protein
MTMALVAGSTPKARATPRPHTSEITLTTLRIVFSPDFPRIFTHGFNQGKQAEATGIPSAPSSECLTI